MGDKVGSNMLARSPLAAFPLVHYSHGQHSVSFAIFFQDPEGRIRHSGAIGDGIAVDVDKGANLGKNFAVVGWNTNVNDDNELRLYYTNTTGHIFERCYTKSRGRAWYDGALTGQFRAAPYSNLAANSQNGERTRVYYQDPDTDEICELFRSSRNGGFEPLGRNPAGLRGTSIATDVGGSVEILYQSQDNKFVHIGGQVHFTSQFEYEAGASIALAGNTVSTGGARVFTVTSNNKLAVTVFDREANKWLPSVELIDVIVGAPVAANDHIKPSTPEAHSTTAFTQTKPHEITRVGFTDENTWNESAV